MGRNQGVNVPRNDGHVNPSSPPPNDKMRPWRISAEKPAVEKWDDKRYSCLDTIIRIDCTTIRNTCTFCDSKHFENGKIDLLKGFASLLYNFVTVFSPETLFSSNNQNCHVNVKKPFKVGQVPDISGIIDWKSKAVLVSKLRGVFYNSLHAKEKHKKTAFLVTKFFRTFVSTIKKAQIMTSSFCLFDINTIFWTFSYPRSQW